MKIVLVNLPWNSFGKTGVRAGSRWPHLKGPTEKDYLPFPFFLAYTAALLKKHGFDAMLIDAIADKLSYRNFLKLIQRVKPHLLVCETSTVTLNHDLMLLERLDKNIPIAICGPDINIRQPEFLKNHKYVTYVFTGEYEFTLLDLAKHLKENKSLEDVSGLMYHDLSAVKSNPPRPLVDLDDLPWPLRQGLPMQRYNDSPGDLPLPSVQMLASRGCPYKCKFCLWPQVMYQSSQYRARDIIDVVDEMEYLVKEMRFKSIYFDDDTFNIGRDRMLRLCDEIKKRKLNIPWAIMARADLMDEEILENMKDAGLFAVKYGVESATQKLLNTSHKDMNLKKTEAIINITKMLGIKTHLTFTFGLAGETKQSIQDTIDFALKLDPATIQFSIATPFPGTAFYEEMKKMGYILSEKWAEYDGNSRSVICSNNISSKELECAIKSAYKQWAVHCARRRQFKKVGLNAYSCQLLANSLKKQGIFITLFKIFKFSIRYLILLPKEKLFYKKNIEKAIKANRGLAIGRLVLIFEPTGLKLFWDKMELTRHAGFSTCFNSEDEQFRAQRFSFWNFEKISNTIFLLKRRCNILPVEETWRLEIVDEKQIVWDIDIDVKKEMEFSEKKVAVILSEKYCKWIDAWGEGQFPHINDYKEIELKNPKSCFIGVRGRKKLKGQLPTILLDFSKNNGNGSPSIKNATNALGARMLEVKMGGLAVNGKQAPGKYKFFSGRIKIVEEDFRKRKLGLKNEN